MTDANDLAAHREYEPPAQAERERLVRRAQAVLGDVAEAEDVVQATLLAVWQRVRSGHVNNEEAYLRKAVEWNALKRRARRRRNISLDEVEEVMAPQDDAGDEDEIDPETLEAALDGLPQRQQAVIRMKYYAGLTFREIAETLAISANTAASTCRYGLAAIRKKMMKTDRNSSSKESI
jgi:RNA polymerase sigma factor (sigma-70 family)